MSVAMLVGGRVCSPGKTKTYEVVSILGALTVGGVRFVPLHTTPKNTAREGFSSPKLVVWIHGVDLDGNPSKATIRLQTNRKLKACSCHQMRFVRSLFSLLVFNGDLHSTH